MIPAMPSGAGLQRPLPYTITIRDRDMKKTPLIFAAIIAAGSLLPLMSQAAEDASGAAPATDAAPATAKKTHAKKHKSSTGTTKKKTATQ